MVAVAVTRNSERTHDDAQFVAYAQVNPATSTCLTCANIDVAGIPRKYSYTNTHMYSSLRSETHERQSFSICTMRKMRHEKVPGCRKIDGERKSKGGSDLPKNGSHDALTA